MLKNAFIFAGLVAFTPALSVAQEAAKSWFSNAMNPAVGFVASFLGSATRDASKNSFAEDPSGSSDGFVRVPGPGDRFGLQESELTLVSDVDHHWKLSANLVFASDEVTPEEVFASNNQIPGISLKLGKFKTAFGKHGLLHGHAFPFIDPPLILERSIGGEGFNGEGLEAAWFTPLPWFCELTLGGYSASGGGEGGLDLAGTRPDAFSYLGHAKNFFDLSDSLSLEAGGSTLMGKGSDGLVHSATGADLTLKFLPPKSRTRRSFILQGEWIQKVSQSKAAGVYQKEAEGGYVSLQLRFAQGWWLGGRCEGTIRAPEAVFVPRFSAAGAPELNTEGEPLYDPAEGDLRRQALELVWAPSEFSAIRADASYARIRGGGLERPDRRILVQFIQVIGAHPAHAF